ncbi:hypothetical protein EJB05_29855 [Eragrostis curvula]|uniref:WRKY domain-containing protein n=1 Tax=Eragrostis curvula TaxID=38414 RepID=A0A5J9UVV9_9POAL|nr:hypothetical protein EJB05_29855 [Eragrostis curvula]
MTLGRQRELVAQLRELLFPATTDECSSVKLETGESTTRADAVACGGRRRRRASGKRAWGHDDEAAAGSNPQPRCSKRRKKQQSSSLVTSTPDFDGYQWRKYGQKQIEGAMYPRSYYRCTWSAEQGCPAKRTVQRNDDDIVNGGVDGSPPKYTVVYVAEHTCSANESMEAPVILETTAVPTTNDNRPTDADDLENNVAGPAFLAPPETRHDAAAAAVDAASSPATTAFTAGTESPATSDDVTWSSASDHVVVDDYDSSWMFAGAVDDSWAPTTPPVESSLVQDMDDFTGPIRSPVHVAAGGCWTIDPYLLLVNEPITNFLAGFSF